MDKDIIFGFHSIIEAIRAGQEIEKVLVRRGLKGMLFNELFELVKELGVPYQYVPPEKLDRLTRKNHQGVVAHVSAIEYSPIEVLLPQIFERGRVPLLLVLDRVTDVRNFGAIARSAECAGVDALVVPGRGSALVNSDAMKTSAGALHNIPVCRSQNLKQTLLFLRESGLRIVAATEKGADLLYQVDMTGPTAIILGAEDTGIEIELIRMADSLCRIPIRGKIDSLNVSVASALMAYEAVRQRLVAEAAGA